jgi:uncharacterized protein (DUF1499 family)
MVSLSANASGGAKRVLRYLPFVALLFAALAVLLLAAGPVGWRLGWWHFRFAFTQLMPYAGYFGIAAMAVAVLSLVFGRNAIRWQGMAIGVLAFVAGGAIAYVPWHYDTVRRTVPPIHDITTDPDNPPQYAAVLPQRASEAGNTTVYEGAKLAEQQKRAYPDLAPLAFAASPQQAFDKALDAAKGMGWVIVASDPDKGRIEASDTSLWFGFTDDIVIRVSAEGAGSRIDLRSCSRQGRSDFGVNAARIRAYLAKLRGNSV